MISFAGNLSSISQPRYIVPRGRRASRLRPATRLGIPVPRRLVQSLYPREHLRQVLGDDPGSDIRVRQGARGVRQGLRGVRAWKRGGRSGAWIGQDGGEWGYQTLFD